MGHIDHVLRLGFGHAPGYRTSEVSVMAAPRMYTEEESRAMLEKWIYNPLSGRVHCRNTLKPVGSRRITQNGQYWQLSIVSAESKKEIRPYVHRFAWYATHGEWPTEIDHDNRDGLDNRLTNIRLATREQNHANEKRRITNTTGVKGVYFNKRLGKFAVRVGLDGKRYFGGHHEKLDEAKAAVRKLREKLHGEFANHGNDA